MISATSAPAALGRRVRLYQTIRTAHLEQAAALTPATILYRQRRYDFDEAATAGLDLVRAGPFGVALLLLRSRVREFEINEPLMRYGIRGSALAILALRAGARLTRRRVSIVSYGIENLDPFAARPTGMRQTASALIDRVVTRWVWRRVDRFVYGTEAARSLYHSVLGPVRPSAEEVMILTLPSRCGREEIRPDDSAVVFLGAFSERKGFPLLREAWRDVRERMPAARLTLVGKGPLEYLARAWAADDATVDLIVDPPRDEIHRVLARSRVLTLPSQAMPTWKEQLGLPITEALAHGCRIVSTSETGLSRWLSDHGHRVIDPGGTAHELADALVSALQEGPSTDDVLATLPVRDGRLAADDWMFCTESGLEDQSLIVPDTSSST